MRTLTRVTPQERATEVSRRLHALTGGSENVLATMRDPDRNRDLVSRLEVAYLVKLRSVLDATTKHVYVETVVAGRPDDVVRRVFARVTHREEDDGTTFDLYSGLRDARFSGVPVTTASTPARASHKKRTTDAPAA